MRYISNGVSQSCGRVNSGWHMIAGTLCVETDKTFTRSWWDYLVHTDRNINKIIHCDEIILKTQDTKRLQDHDEIIKDIHIERKCLQGEYEIFWTR